MQDTTTTERKYGLSRPVKVPPETCGQPDSLDPGRLVVFSLAFFLHVLV